MKSIMQKKDGTCYLCRKLHSDYGTKPVQEHHVIFGTANRKLSEKYGLKVYLCPEHHLYSKEAVHVNHEIDLKLRKEAQRAFVTRFPDSDFRQIFGKSYLTEPEVEELKKKQSQMCASEGFTLISGAPLRN